MGIFNSAANSDRTVSCNDQADISGVDPTQRIE